jgi:threonylcarbamoyladenosine tRNA methylthiotransferase MtaB
MMIARTQPPPPAKKMPLPHFELLRMTADTLRTVTLGCKVNHYETQWVREGLLGIGFRDAQPDEQAAVCVVNTCTVTAEGDAKSRQAIRRLARLNPAARIVVMGCYATRAPEEVAALPGVAEVVTDKRELPDLLARFGVLEMPRGISGMPGMQRAYVKVQDGCLLRCSFCIIPHVRPALASRGPDEIVEEVQRLVEHGFREVVLTGIHLGHYGVDLNRGRPKGDWVRLSHLLRRLATLPGEFRVRLSSIEATEVTHDLIAVLADHAGRICPHLHISMQSGSDAVLARMRRRWGSRRFVDRCRLVCGELHRPALTTDVIVGFPGETEADFAATCQVVSELGFSKVHIFPFSPRKSTPAASMSGQVPAAVKAQRAERLAELAQRVRAGYFAALAGERLQVLVESPIPDRPGRMLGTACRYAPVELAGDWEISGRLIDVLAGSVEDGRIQAHAQRRPSVG